MKDCDCGQSYRFSVEGKVSDVANDVNLSNNYDYNHVQVNSDIACGVSCNDSWVNPTTKVSGDGEDFTITCKGSNLDYFLVNVYNNGQLIDTSNQLVDADSDGVEVWNYTQDTV